MKDSESLFSFENICETLGLYPDYIRHGLLCWKEAKLKTYSVKGHRAGRPKLARTRVTHPSGRLLQFFPNLRIDIADSDTESVKLPVDEELKDSRPAINDFDCGVFLFLEAF